MGLQSGAVGGQDRKPRTLDETGDGDDLERARAAVLGVASLADPRGETLPVGSCSRQTVCVCVGRRAWSLRTPVRPQTVDIIIIIILILDRVSRRPGDWKRSRSWELLNSSRRDPILASPRPSFATGQRASQAPCASTSTDFYDGSCGTSCLLSLALPAWRHCLCCCCIVCLVTVCHGSRLRRNRYLVLRT